MSASGWARPSNNEFVFGNNLSSIHAPAMPRCSSLAISLLALLKFPYPVSASSSIGMSVASLMNSRTSTTCVQEASLLSRTPSCAEIDKPLPQIPLNPGEKIESRVNNLLDRGRAKYQICRRRADQLCEDRHDGCFASKYWLETSKTVLLIFLVISARTFMVVFIECACLGYYSRALIVA